MTALATETRVVLSFDVEEHYRIEAAAGLEFDEPFKAHCRDRVDVVSRWLLDELGRRGIRATFFVVGETARDNPALIRAMHAAGHEVASHSWDHRRLHRHTPASFREDVRTSKDVIEQITAEPVVGYRAPTFSVVAQTAWAIDVLAGQGMLYDSSVYPVRHDRYGVPDAPRTPFLAAGGQSTLLELPPATLRWLGSNIPVGGGGYFRLLPVSLLERGVRQVGPQSRPPTAVLYFHPWEFDPDQERLPLRTLSRFRTYVGVTRSRRRLGALLGRHHFVRAVDVARELAARQSELPCYRFAAPADAQAFQTLPG